MRILCIFGVLLASFIVVADESTKVEGSFVIPKSVGSFSGQVVSIRLYEFDPFLADVSATLIEHLEIKGFGHKKGAKSEETFVIGSKGKIKPRMSYYVTLFILKDGKRSHMGQVPGKFMAKVLTEGNPREIRMVVKKVG